MGSLPELLAGLIAGSVTVPVVSWILEMVGEVSKTQKRYIALIASLVLGIGAFWASIALGYTDRPESLAAMTEALWPVVGAAFTASQIILSGAKDLRIISGRPHG